MIAGDAEKRESDFLAVVDVDRQSPTYTEVVTPDPAHRLPDENGPLSLERPARVKTCETSSQRRASGLAPRFCPYILGSADSWHHAPQVARLDRKPGGSRDSDIRR
jgi:hypothetical protein